jgi:integrase
VRYRQLLRTEGVDPLQRRAAMRAQAAVDAAKGITFQECAESYIAAHASTWKNAKHREQWPSTLVAYAYPVFGKLPVAAVDTALVTKALEPIWNDKPETAGRVRGRVEAVLDWAKVRGYRAGDNPARWRGHLKILLPGHRRVRHHPALPYSEIPALVAELRQREAAGAGALEFLILTAARTAEAIGARWDEITGDVWVVPAARMKGGREHRVPLSQRALEILAARPRAGDFVFTMRGGRPLGDNALWSTLRRMGRSNVTTVHGLRSSFRDWAAERTNFPGDVVEMALAHKITSSVEAAYRRGDLLDKRRRLMAAWAEYVLQPAAAGVVPIRGAGNA